MPLERVFESSSGSRQDSGAIDLTGLDADELAKVAEYVAFLKERRFARFGAPHPPAGPASKKILIIDDDQEICELLHMFLESHGYKVCLAFNARMGLECFRDIRPDIVLLDLKMPDMDGVEALKAMHVLRVAPTVIITGHPELVSDVQSSGVSIDGYLEKPLMLEKVLRMLARILGKNDDGKEKA